jgi:hypothetical protein
MISLCPRAIGIQFVLVIPDAHRERGGGVDRRGPSKGAVAGDFTVPGRGKSWNAFWVPRRDCPPRRSHGWKKLWNQEALESFPWICEAAGMKLLVSPGRLHLWLVVLPSAAETKAKRSCQQGVEDR